MTHTWTRMHPETDHLMITGPDLLSGECIVSRADCDCRCWKGVVQVERGEVVVILFRADFATRAKARAWCRKQIRRVMGWVEEVGE